MAIFLSKLWTQHAEAVLGLLAIADLMLALYVVKKLPTLFKKNSKSSEMEVLKTLASSQDPSALFQIKAYLTSLDDHVALFAFKELLKRSEVINMDMLKEVIFRTNNRKALLVASFMKIARKNPTLLTELFKIDLPEWVYMACLKIVVKFQLPDSTALLMNAQEHSSPAIHNCAKELLEKIDTALHQAS